MAVTKTTTKAPTMGLTTNKINRADSQHHQQNNQQQQEQQQQQKQHRKQHPHCGHLLQLQPLQCATIAVVGIIFGLLCSVICVSGQIDGYIAGEDYPAYESVPKGLSFQCNGRLPGYYADIETRCQVWHWCLHSGHQYSFLCPNGTVFNQAVRVCDWWTNVNCPAAEQLYENNDELYRPTEPIPEGDI